MNIRNFACALLTLSLGAVACAEDGREQAATAAASGWLQLLDQAKYADAWGGFANDGEGIQTQEEFERVMASVTKKMGKVTARSVTCAKDDGKDVVIEYAVARNKTAGRITETVTLVQEPSGNWKVTNHALHHRASGVVTRR